MGARRGNHLRVEPIRRTKVEVRVGKLKNRKATGKDEGKGEMTGWWTGFRDCNMAFESGGVPEDWRSAVIVPLYKGKEERTECNNYRGISLLR